MTWSWSFGTEGESAIQNAIMRMPIDRAIEGVVNEWVAQFERRSSLSGRTLCKHLETVDRFERNRLTVMAEKDPTKVRNLAWTIASEHRTCSVGGHEIWIDSEGFVTLTWDEIDALNRGDSLEWSKSVNV